MAAQEDKESLLGFIKELAQASGGVVAPHFSSPHLEVETKDDDTPVTIADRAAERLMRDMIRSRYPEHGVIGEEYGSEREGSDFVWVLDPIDGTKAFAAGCPLFGTLICLLREGRPWLGAISQPVLGQLLIGDGERSFLNGAPVRVSQTAQIERASLLATDLGDPRRHQDGARWDALCESVRQLRTWGDCYGYMLVATGGADIMCDSVLSPWDLMALIPVIQGAGGKITDWQGGDPAKGSSIVAANPMLHPLVIEALNG